MVEHGIAHPKSSSSLFQLDWHIRIRISQLFYLSSPPHQGTYARPASGEKGFLDPMIGSMDCRIPRFARARVHGLFSPRRIKGSRTRDSLGLRSSRVQTSWSAADSPRPADHLWRNRQLSNATEDDGSATSFELRDQPSDPYQNYTAGRRWQAYPLPSSTSLQVLSILLPAVSIIE